MIIKIAFFCAGVLAVSATKSIGIDVDNTGESSTLKQQDSDGSYAFSYDIVDEHGASNSRSESGDAFGNKKGSYTLYDTDGRSRVVNYIADEHGFRAVVNTNEPGTAQSNPAGVIINSPYPDPSNPASDPVSIVHDVPAPISAPVSVVHEVPVPVSAPISVVHEVPIPVSVPVTKVSHPIKSVVSHAAPVFDFAAPVFKFAAPVVTFNHAVPGPHIVPPTYSTKSFISHHTPITVSKTVAAPYAYSTPLAYLPKSVASHATVPVAYSTKSVVSHSAPIAHAAPVAIASPGSYSPKSVVAKFAPFAKSYASAPGLIPSYKSIFNGGPRFGDIGYSHGLFGPRFGGLSYSPKRYNYGLQGHGFGGILYGNPYGHGYHRYGYGILGSHTDEHSYGKEIYGYNGLKPYYY